MADHTIDQNIEDFFAEHPDLTAQGSYAVAVSGGPDSMALAYALSQHLGSKKDLHLITVDHGLRAEAKEEASMVAKWAKENNVTHTILKWQGDKPDTGVMEAARDSRYEIMADYCRTHKIKTLFVGHHQDDQMETFLIRLFKGSGLDGLASMSPLRNYDENLKLARPLLDVSKKDILDFCEMNNIPFATDPSNENDTYLRPRLRKLIPELEEEGLSGKRISTLVKRLARVRKSLELLTDQAFEQHRRAADTKNVIMDYVGLSQLPEEIVLRVIQKALEMMRPESKYNVRMEKLEELFESMWNDPKNFKPRTLGGCIFSLEDNQSTLVIKKEQT